MNTYKGDAHQVTESNTPQVTVGLISYNEKQNVGTVLSDLKSQSSYNKIAEIVLVKNSNCQETSQVIESFLNQLPLKIINNPNNNIGQSRALIVEQAKYPLIAFTDGDCSLPKNWMEDLLKHWHVISQKNGIALAAPNRLPKTCWRNKMLNLSLCHPLGHAWSPQAWIPKQIVSTYHIPTTNALFLREKILEAGNFSSQYPRVGEDLDLGLRLKKLGSLYLSPQPIVINNNSESYFQSLKRLFSFAQVNAKRNPNLLLLSTGLLAPIMFSSIIASFFQIFYMIFLSGYLCILFATSLYLYFKNREREILLLPLFWLPQHLAYSLGILTGLYKKYFVKMFQ